MELLDDSFNSRIIQCYWGELTYLEDICINTSLFISFNSAKTCKMQFFFFFFAFTFAIKDPNFFSSFHEYVELPLVYNTVLVLKDLGRLGKQ